MTMKIDKTNGSVKRMSVDQYVRERKKHKKQGAFDEILQQEVTKLKSGRNQYMCWFEAVFQNNLQY